MKRLGDVLRAALCAATALQPWRVLRAAQMAGTDAFLGFTPASAEELSDAGRAAPDTDHAAAAGSGAPTVSHNPPRAASATVSRWLQKRDAGECDRRTSCTGPNTHAVPPRALPPLPTRPAPETHEPRM